MIRHAALVTVCSDFDRSHFGEAPNVVVVPNGYERVSGGGWEDQLPSVPRPRLIIQGSYDYGPNIVAASDFARDILPLIRNEIPGAALVVAGKYSDELQELAGRPDVVTTGYVENMSAMVQSCDLVVAPVRAGSGTRVKILEAWANRVPVVATELGAEGLGATHGDQILIAEEPDAFAESCVTLLKDHRLRGRLIRSASRLFEERYVWDGIASDFVAMFRAHLDLADGAE